MTAFSEINSRPLPQALDVERVLLGSAISDKESLALIVDQCRTDDFYTPADRKIYFALAVMFAKQQPVDLVLLCEYFKQSGELESIGGEAYLCELAENLCASANIPHYVKQLKGKSARRRIIEAIDQARAAAFDEDTPLEKTIQEFQEVIAPNEIQVLPAPVSGKYYAENGIPDRKPELIGGILRQSHKLLIGAPSKFYKSYLAIRLALSITHGREWLGFPCKQGPVYIVNFEIDEGSYLHRVQTVANALDIPIPENITFQHLRGYGAPIEELLPAIARHLEGKDYSAIIFDPQYKLLRSRVFPSFSENDAAGMSYLYGELDRHFSRRGVSPVVISHFAKGMASGKEMIDRVAGSGAPMRDVDALVTLTPLDSPDACRMEFALREFKPPEPLSLHWEYPLHSIDSMLDGVALKTRPGRPGADVEADDRVVLTKVQELDSGASQSAVRAALAGVVGRPRVVDALQRLVISGKLSASIGKKNATIYAVK